MKKLSLFIITTFIFFAFFAKIEATNHSDVLINEVAWMGSANSATDEWVELKNNTDRDISLEDWLLKTADEKIKAYLKGTIPARGFYLLERTDDNSVPNVAADFIYKGSLNNKGEDLVLFKNSSYLIDEVAFTSQWPAGDNATKQTMERTNSGWQTSQNPNGTPKAENSVLAPEAAEKTEPALTKIEDISIEAMSPKTYPDGIIINEILPAPEGPDEINEWIELHNSNNFDVDLQDFKIQDTQGTAITYTFLKNAKIPGNGYLILKRPETKIVLNNDRDSLNLILPNEKIIDSVSYKEAVKNQSYNKTKSGWQWTNTLTPGSLNIITVNSADKDILSKQKKSDNGNKTNQNIAAISESVNKSVDLFSDKLSKEKERALNPWFLFLIATTITIISGIIILILKLKLKKYRPTA